MKVRRCSLTEVISSPSWSAQMTWERTQLGFSDLARHPGVSWPVGPSLYLGVRATGWRRDPLTRRGELSALPSVRGTEAVPAAVNFVLGYIHVSPLICRSNITTTLTRGCGHCKTMSG